MDANSVLDMVTSTSFGIWFLIGAALVFFMQAGFAMVETGFTRAKSAGNIIMKNLMDFCIGSVVFMFLGFGLMMSEDYIAGVIGAPNLGIFTNYSGFDYSSFVFQLVFCATAATIVSGSMAERTKFSAYCIYSAVISAVVYPIEAGWVWNSAGWLHQLQFVDFAGSAVIHTVGGTTALIGAILVGPRIGKYSKTKSGKIKSNAIPGHSLTLGALGVFILWFGWYGFNGAACTSIESLGSVFLTTTVATGAATVSCMIFTWIKDGKPDVGMCLNASLAGLVAITAPCASVDALGAFIIGIVAGILVDVVVELLDKKLHIDDPVGAVGCPVHHRLLDARSPVRDVALGAETRRPRRCSSRHYRPLGRADCLDRLHDLDRAHGLNRHGRARRQHGRWSWRWWAQRQRGAGWHRRNRARRFFQRKHLRRHRREHACRRIRPARRHVRQRQPSRAAHTKCQRLSLGGSDHGFAKCRELPAGKRAPRHGHWRL